jgi:hypothetical protein
MNEQVMIFCIAESENQNFLTLLNKDKSIFYWNDKKFSSLNSDDFVIIVNKHNNIVMLTKFDKDTTLNEAISNDKTTITDLKTNESVVAEGISWGKFIRFKVIDFIENIDADWSKNWIHPGTGGVVYLNKVELNYKSGLNKWVVDTDKKEKRISEIEKLLILDSKGEFKDLLIDLKSKINGKEVSKIATSIITTTPNIQNEMHILTAIKTKPFILLAGISGTGKSRLVRTLAFKTCSKSALRTNPKKPGNFEIIPVRPNWHDSSELMGYVSRIDGEKYITTTFLKFIAKAWKNIEIPFFLCLDEMNLAPVEQYFAEYLSIIETREVHNNEIATDYLIAKASFQNPKLYAQILDDLELGSDPKFSEGMSIPKNLVVIGTVNMDETTHSFSRKVLDRAMTFEMNEVDLSGGLDSTKKDWDYPQEFISADNVIGEFTAGSQVIDQYSESKNVIEFLKKINTELEGTAFKIAYRVRDEFLIYCYYASKVQSNSNWLNISLDEMTSMKVLPRIEGDEYKTGKVLERLIKHLNDGFPISNKKLVEMDNKLKIGYTSYWT